MIRGLAVLLAAILLLSLLLGDGTVATPDWLILTRLRLPRTVLAALVGGVLIYFLTAYRGKEINPR